MGARYPFDVVMITQLVLPLLLVAADTAVTRAQKPRFEPAMPYVAPDKWFAEDKLRHFAYSYVITAGTAAAARTVTGRNESVAIGAAFGLAAGIAKEIYDKKTNRSASFRDLLWDIAGVSVGVLVAQQAR
jgi:uncharacterized protein YfiM (DUF2279 family)